jgi:DNA-directed RNA polymerase subunit H (RpoH/RPB5)
MFTQEGVLTEKDTLVLITNDYSVDSIHKALKNIWELKKIYVVLFDLKQLQLNVLKHRLVPKHVKLSAVEKTDLYHTLNIEEDKQLPEISRFDPVAKTLFLRPGEVCRITRFDKISYTNDNTNEYSNNNNKTSNGINLLNTNEYNLSEDEKRKAIEALDYLKSIENKINNNDKKYSLDDVKSPEITGPGGFIVKKAEDQRIVNSNNNLQKIHKEESINVHDAKLIESINETCYDLLDDVLIEEEDDYYTINTSYFKRISLQ